MYATFFGLRQEPFSIAPDPRFLFMSDKHREALALLQGGLQRGASFVLLTGEIGAGKTTVWRRFLQDLPSNVDVASVVNPRLDVTALLARVCEDLQVGVPAGTHAPDLIDLLHGHLLLAHAQGRRTLIVIDEAQALSGEVLEQLRLLTNLDTSGNKLQVMLIGQPELRQILQRPQLEPLAQRVVARYHLPALSAAETTAYIDHRLRVAGLSGTLPFDPAALAAVHWLCRGVPRRINVLCDSALQAACTQGSRQVGVAVVEHAAAQTFGEPLAPAAVQPASKGFDRPVAPAGAAALAAAPPAAAAAGAGAPGRVVADDGPHGLPWGAGGQGAGMAALGAGHGNGGTPKLGPGLVGQGGGVGPVADDHRATPLPAGTAPTGDSKSAIASWVTVAGLALAAGVLLAPWMAGLRLPFRAPAVTAAAAPPAVTTAPAPAMPIAAALPAVALPLPSTDAAFSPSAIDPGPAWRALAPLWGVTLGAGEPCAVAAQQGLQCFRSRGGLAPIRQLARPGIVKLVDDRGRVAHVLLTALSDDAAMLTIAGVERSVPLTHLARMWRGDFFTFWRAPPGTVETEAGATAPPDWLAERMPAVDGQGPLGTGDEALRARVFRFQLAQGLAPDGLAGPLTLMLLNRASGVAEPKLAAMPLPAAAGTAAATSGSRLP